MSDFWNEPVSVRQTNGEMHRFQSRRALAEVAASSVLARADLSKTAGAIAATIVDEIVRGFDMAEPA